MIKIAVTGHRPQSLSQEEMQKGQRFLESLLGFLKKTDEVTCISGMALGVDTVFAQLAEKLEIPLIAAIPDENQTGRWRYQDRSEHTRLLRVAREVVNVKQVTRFTGSYPALLQRRNVWMADECTHLVAIWTGKKSGGTFNCLTYFSREYRGKKKLLIYNPVTNTTYDWSTFQL